jgi:hypothetical protein
MLAICELADYYEAVDSGSIYHRNAKESKHYYDLAKKRGVNCETLEKSLANTITY